MTSPFDVAWALLKQDSIWPEGWFDRPNKKRNDSEDYIREELARMGGQREQEIFGAGADDDAARSAIRSTYGGYWSIPTISWYDRLKWLRQREEDAFNQASREGELSMNQAPFLNPSQNRRAMSRAKDWRTYTPDAARQVGWEPERFAEFKLRPRWRNPNKIQEPGHDLGLM